MTSNPWGKFFWNDWENDPALKLCGLSAQGLWMRILCICAKADPKGYLIAAGRPLSPSDLASLVGKPVPEVETLLLELSTHGVFSTDRKGRIYSRRMVRDEKKSRTNVENGKKGGNPSLSNSNEILASDNPPLKPDDKPHNPISIFQKPENRISSFVVGRGGGKAPMSDENKIALFQRWLAEGIGKDGWRIVGVAADPEADGYVEAVQFCREFARSRGKGWPHKWPVPRDEVRA